MSEPGQRCVSHGSPLVWATSGAERKGTSGAKAKLGRDVPPPPSGPARASALFSRPRRRSRSRARVPPLRDPRRELRGSRLLRRRRSSPAAAWHGRSSPAWQLVVLVLSAALRSPAVVGRRPALCRLVARLALLLYAAVAVWRALTPARRTVSRIGLSGSQLRSAHRPTGRSRTCSLAWPTSCTAGAVGSIALWVAADGLRRLRDRCSVSSRWFESFSIPGYSAYETNQKTVKTFGTGEQFAARRRLPAPGGDVTKDDRHAGDREGRSASTRARVSAPTSTRTTRSTSRRDRHTTFAEIYPAGQNPFST